MKLGIAIPHYGPAMTSSADLRRFARQAEGLGYHSLWAGDRLFTRLQPDSAYPDGDYRPYLDKIARFADPFAVVATSAAVTSRVRFNFSALNAPLYDPVLLARSLTTLDFLTDGRLGAGFGLGWMRDEYDALGLPWSQRGARLDDALSFLRAWWTTNPVEYESPLLSFPRSRVDLRPVQPGGPPIYLGGASRAALVRVGRRAAGWLGFDAIPPRARTAMWDTVRRAAEEAGRDPDALIRLIRVNGEPGESVAHIAGRLARLAETGVEEAFVDFLFTCSTIDEFLAAAERLVPLKSW